MAQIAAALAKVGWRSPLEPVAGKDIRKAWAKLWGMQKRIILETLVDVHVWRVSRHGGIQPSGVEVTWLM